MDISDIWQILSNPQIWPLFLTFLGGYVMMNVFLGHSHLKKNFTELERILIAFGIGFLFEYFMFYPPILLVNFWRPFLMSDAYTTSAILFCAVSASALFYAIYGERKETFIKWTKSILMILIIPFSAFMVLVLLIGMSKISWYPYSVLVLIWNSWWSFMGLAIISFFMFLGGVFFLCIYVLKSSFTLESLKKQMRAKRNILISVLEVTMVVAVGLVTVPLDTQFGLFTPRVQNGQELFSSAMATGNGFYKVVFISATRGAQDNVTATYRYYALMNTTYNITLPMFRLLSSVYLNNPSNASFSIGENWPSLPNPTESWKKIYLTVPSNVTYETTFKKSPRANELSGLTISFGNLSGQSWFLAGMNYWQEVSSIENVEVDYHNLAFTDFGNNTWMEAHTIKIRNNSNDTLEVPALEYDRFNFDYVIRNSTNVYLNGKQSWTELIWPTRLALDVTVPPQRVFNLTITFLTKQDPS